MTTRAPNFRPPNALIMWRDANNIYVALPGPGEEDTIISYQFSTGGLAKALALLGPPPDRASGPAMPARPTKASFAYSEFIQDILRKQGLIK